MGMPTRENLKHREAFEIYYSLGDKRNLSEVARQMNVSVVAVSKWSSAFKWADQIIKRDAELAEMLSEQTKESVLADKGKLRMVTKALIEQFLADFRLGTVKCKNVTDLATVAKLNLLLNGEDTDKTGVSVSIEDAIASLKEVGNGGGAE